MLVVIFSFTLFTGVLAEVGKTYNYFVFMEEDINKSYKDIDVTYKKRFEITTRVEKILRDYIFN